MPVSEPPGKAALCSFCCQAWKLPPSTEAGTVPYVSRRYSRDRRSCRKAAAKLSPGIPSPYFCWKMDKAMTAEAVVSHCAPLPQLLKRMPYTSSSSSVELPMRSLSKESMPSFSTDCKAAVKAATFRSFVGSTPASTFQNWASAGIAVGLGEESQGTLPSVPIEKLCGYLSLWPNISWTKTRARFAASSSPRMRARAKTSMLCSVER
mmetsp:Transcript_66615/g.158957  ORF Transcript_66615/g.158957 Transcript_66615/m.158957 type:complete len:207 (-) Transcript_66615:190-810(-)